MTSHSRKTTKFWFISVTNRSIQKKEIALKSFLTAVSDSR